MLKINEVFFSIQGESSFVGWPTVFVRTSGCPLRCTYCDTQYAYYDGEKISLEDILKKVSSFSAKHVCVTGGEPLSQKQTLELMARLCDLGYVVSVETSGAVTCAEVDKRVKKIIDVKTPDSGAADSFLLENLTHTTVNDEFKFVICSEKDFHWSENFVQTHLSSDQNLVLYSPSFGVTSNKQLAEWILKSGSRARMQVQLHKYIWSPDTRGV
jgi:7-carboxy-7-deazaguanine synthase